MRRLRIAVGLAIAMALWVIVPSAVAGAARPDLRVSGGTVRLADSTVRGFFTVANHGRVGAPASVAALRFQVGRRELTPKRYPLPPLPPGAARTVRVRIALSKLPGATVRLLGCADWPGAVRERSEGDNCRRLGSIRPPLAGLGNDALPGGPGAGASVPSPPVSPIDPSGPRSSVPTNPVPYTPGTPFRVQSTGADYWASVPAAYDASHSTPTTLLVWLHGCSGFSSGDIQTVAPGAGESWIAIAPGGREGGCWEPGADGSLVRAAVADVKTHFNVDPRRVVLGGYSSGGDLAYRTAFYDSCAYAGLLIVNSSPFRDTGSSQAESLAAASCRFHVVHLAHLQDATYPIAGVRKETDAVTAAGFPLQRIEVDGTHFDEAGDMVNGHSVPGTDADIRTYLLPHLGDGWLSP